MVKTSAPMMIMVETNSENQTKTILLMKNLKHTAFEFIMKFTIILDLNEINK